MKGLYVAAAVTMAGVGSVFALLAELDERYRLGEGSLGWIAGAAFAAALVTQLGLSRYADRGFAKPLLYGGVLLAAIGLLWFAAATELWQFVAARAVLGAAVGMIVPAARRAIVMTAPSGDLGARLGVFYAAYLSGFVFGPPVAGMLTLIGDVRLPFVVLGLACAGSALGLRDLRMDDGHDDPDHRGADDDDDGAASDRRVLRRLIRRRAMVAALLVVVSFRYSIGVFEPLWAVYLDDLGASTMVITVSLTIFALPMLVVARRAGHLTDRLGARWTSLLAAAATVPLMATYGWVGVLPLVIGLSIPHGVFEAIESPGTQVAVADAAPRSEAAAAQGLAEAAGSAAAAIGAFTAAPLYARIGAGWAWMIAGSVMAALLTLSWMLDPPRRRPRRPVDPVSVAVDDHPAGEGVHPN
ncbi:MAG: MFS transporter [Desertimonas sp.]